MTKVVWILSHYAQEPSGGGAGGTRHYSLCQSIRSLGWKPVIVASSVEHGTGRQRLGDAEKTRLEEIGGVTFLWVKGPSYTTNGLARIRNMLSYFFNVMQGETTDTLPRPDVVVGSSFHPLAALAGYFLAKRRKAAFVFEVRDLWPETIIAMGKISRNGPVAVVMRQWEKYLYKRAQRIITLLPSAHEYIGSLGIDSSKVRWLPNGAVITNFNHSADKVRGGPFTFMYFGSHGVANGLAPVIRAFAKVRKEYPALACRLRMVGSGPEKTALRELAESLSTGEDISFEPPVPKSAIPALAAEADAFVVNLRDLELYRYGISLNKMFEYMAAARPILFAGNPKNNMVKDALCGITVAPDDVDAISKGMVAMVQADPYILRTWGSNGRQYVIEHFDYQKLGHDFSRILDEAIANKADA